MGAFGGRKETRRIFGELSFGHLGWPSGAFGGVFGGLVGYVASCGRLMVDWGRRRRLSLETLGTPRWTLIRKKDNVNSMSLKSASRIRRGAF